MHTTHPWVLRFPRQRTSRIGAHINCLLRNCTPTLLREPNGRIDSPCAPRSVHCPTGTLRKPKFGCGLPSQIISALNSPPPPQKKTKKTKKKKKKKEFCLLTTHPWVMRFCRKKEQVVCLAYSPQRLYVSETAQTVTTAFCKIVTNIQTIQFRLAFDQDFTSSILSVVMKRTEVKVVGKCETRIIALSLCENSLLQLLIPCAKCLFFHSYCEIFSEIPQSN